MPAKYEQQMYFVAKHNFCTSWGKKKFCTQKKAKKSEMCTPHITHPLCQHFFHSVQLLFVNCTNQHPCRHTINAIFHTTQTAVPCKAPCTAPVLAPLLSRRGQRRRRGGTDLDADVALVQGQDLDLRAVPQPVPLHRPALPGLCPLHQLGCSPPPPEVQERLMGGHPDPKGGGGEGSTPSNLQGRILQHGGQ